jgi:sugar phosphate permease
MDRAAWALSWRAPATLDRARAWRVATVGALFAGYAGLYVCRSNLSVAASLIARDSSLPGTSTAAIGAIASVGVLAYALGKPVTGLAGDLFGARRAFVAALWGTVAATLAFAAGGSVWWIGAAWVVNRFIQSAGWGALARVVAHWCAPQRHGRVIAVLSLSFLFGDAAARLALGALLDAGAGWRLVFVASAGVLAIVAFGVGPILRDRPSDRGLPDPESCGQATYGAEADRAASDVGSLVRPLFASPSFLLVCGLSCGLTLVREAFNIWMPTFLSTAYGMTSGDAARWSAIFPLMGGVSVVGAGIWGDRLGPGRRMQLVAPLVLAAGVAAWGAGTGVVMGDARLGLAALAVVALLLMGPYSLLAGAMALEIGGKRGAATAAGLIDTAGYLGAMVSGVVVGATADAYGWSWSWRLLAVILGASATVAACLAHLDGRRAKVARAPDCAKEPRIEAAEGECPAPIRPDTPPAGPPTEHESWKSS